MLRYMLDTDTVSYALRNDGHVDANLRRHSRTEVCISAITLVELRFGAEKRLSRSLHEKIDIFARTVAVLAFDKAAADASGRLAAQLAARGTPIGEIDALIAGHALSANLTLVTNNVKHFARVVGLSTENWL